MTAKPERLPSGRYRATTYNPHAKRKGPSKTFTTFAEAYAWAKRAEADMDRAIREHGIEVTRRDNNITFAAYVASWRDTGAVSSRRTTAAHLKLAARAWPTQRLTEITPVMIRAMLQEMDEHGRAARTRALRVTALRKVFAAAMEDGYRADNPAAKVKPPKTVNDAGRHRNITEDELARIMEHMPEWTHAAILLSRDSGLRIGEICGLPWYRLDLLHARVTVSDVVQPDGTIRTTPKGVAVLTVPLTPRTVAALRTHQNRWPGSKQDQVFHNPRGYTGRTGALSPQTLRQYWNRAVKAAGLDHPAPRWHDLRHSRGHALAEAGAPIQVIQAVLRHASITTTRKYMGPVTVQEQARWMQAADEPRRLVAV